MALPFSRLAPVLTRAELPGDPADTQARYIEAAVNGILVAWLYLPNGNLQPARSARKANMPTWLNGWRAGLLTEHRETALRWQVAFWSSAFCWLVRPCVRPLMRPSHAPLAIMPFARFRPRP
jgi:hypothetical protein